MKLRIKKAARLKTNKEILLEDERSESEKVDYRYE